jgi:acetate---CoA ligase (ADP-forming)
MESDIALRDGSTIHLRPVRPTDLEGVQQFLSELSDRSRWFRYFTPKTDMWRAARWATEVDYFTRFGIVCISGSDPQIAAHAGYECTTPDRAEVAFAVADQLQGKGVATLLLGILCEAAAANGITVFEAEILPDNHQMLDVFRQSGFEPQLRSEPGSIAVEFPTAATEGALERFEDRERTAAVSALGHVLAPRSVAIIGASRRRDTVGAELFHNLLTTGFVGRIYAVNTSADVVESMRAYRTVVDIEDPVDLAVVVVPAPSVAHVARECASKGVRALVVISAGFSETGQEGAKLQAELLSVCRQSGMRLVGPNCLGVANPAPEVSLNATFSPTPVRAGRVGFLSQSGALALAVIDYADYLGLGMSSLVSVGNQADLSPNDLLEYWEEDGSTDVGLLYLESVGNPRKFARIARRVARKKPIVAVKSGRSQAGARATSSHTGALVAASDLTVDALFKQAGVIRTDTLAELFDVASLVANQPVPRGDRVAILTNSGGPGILCADACEAQQLEVISLDSQVKGELASFLPSEAALDNPVDMLATATAADYERALQVIVEAADIDAVIVIFTPPLVTHADPVAEAIAKSASHAPRPVPVIAVFMSRQTPPRALATAVPRIPAYPFPEEAARALSKAASYGRWREKTQGAVPTFGDLRTDRATALIAGALESNRGWLAPHEITELLDCYGLRPQSSKEVTTPAEAAAAAAELGAPVALKAVAAGLVHKSDVGGVRVGLKGRDEILEAADEIAAAVAAAGHALGGYIVQQMADPGVEMLIGVVQDPVFGPVVACGAGGIEAELINDVAVRITPLTDTDAKEMVHSLATFARLTGFRGGIRADVSALEDALLRIAAMVEEHSEIAELDLNPVMVAERGFSVVDARVRVERARPRHPRLALD